MNWIRSLALAAAVAGLPSCAASSGRPATAGAAKSGCEAFAGSLQSRPGREWLKQHGWRFKSAAEAGAAYNRLFRDQSPWPDWFQPERRVLPPGTRFQMAIGGGQSPEKPGAFGTFDRLRRISDVRHYLAVKKEWKPRVDRVVTYEVVQPLPVHLGPVGPQVDGRSCRLLPGRWSQLQMLVAPDQRMTYIKIVETRPLR